MTKAWFDIGGGRKVYRRIPEPKPERSQFPTPMLVRDFDEPVQSMADGNWYSSKAGLSASYKASGNPRGEEFVELGNENPVSTPYTPDPAQRRADIKQAMHDVLSGNMPPEIAAIE